MKTLVKKILKVVLTFAMIVLSAVLFVAVVGIIATDRHLKEAKEPCKVGEHKGVYQLSIGHPKCCPTVKLTNDWTCFNETWYGGNSTSVFDWHDNFLVSQDDYEDGTSKLTHSKEIDDLQAEQLIVECKTKLSEKGLLLPPP